MPWRPLELVKISIEGGKNHKKSNQKKKSLKQNVKVLLTFFNSIEFPRQISCLSTYLEQCNLIILYRIQEISLSEYETDLIVTYPGCYQ